MASIGKCCKKPLVRCLLAVARTCRLSYRELGGLSQTYEFCFEGVERNAVVAVGMIGCKRNKAHFMRGYDAMCERLEPSAVICFGKPFDEMRGNVIAVDYLESRKAVR